MKKKIISKICVLLVGLVLFVFPCKVTYAASRVPMGLQGETIKATMFTNSTEWKYKMINGK